MSFVIISDISYMLAIASTRDRLRERRGHKSRITSKSVTKSLLQILLLTPVIHSLLYSLDIVLSSTKDPISPWIPNASLTTPLVT